MIYTVNIVKYCDHDFFRKQLSNMFSSRITEYCELNKKQKRMCGQF